ncbi:MAG: hypothetical protein ABR529_13985 [Actinomycetota bacterium]
MRLPEPRADHDFGDIRTRIALLRRRAGELPADSGARVEARYHLSDAQSHLALAKHALAAAESARGSRAPAVRVKGR